MWHNCFFPSARSGRITASAAVMVLLGLTAAAPAGGGCIGDLDGNNAVNGADLGALLLAWASSDDAADLNNDGTVDGADLAALLLAFGPCDPPVDKGCVFLVIDEDSIDNGSPPNDFSDVEVNDHIAEVGLRALLPAFSGANIGDQITLWTGQVGDEGWFALKVIPDSWAQAGPTDDGLLNYIMAGPGLGSGDKPEELLDEIPLVTPLRATGLSMLIGETVCAIVYDGDISINYDPLTGNLQGANLGIVAFTVLEVNQLFDQSDSSLPEVLIEIVDPVAAFEGPFTLFLDAPEPVSSSKPFDIVPP